MSEPVDERRFTQPRLHVAGMFVAGLALFVFGLWMIGDGSFAGWLLAACGGILAPASLMMLWRPTAVALSDGGVTVQSFLRSDFYDWDDITSIGIWERKSLGITMNRFVTFDVAGAPRAAAVASRVTGAGNVTLPPVGVDVEELLAIAQRFWANSEPHP